jgi:lipid-A-disaccharide synthase
MSGVPLLIVAGESSGDQRAARLLAALAARLPGVTAFGLGSDSLRAAGMETLADSHEIAVIGIAEALEVLPRAAEIMDRLLREVERRRPAAAVLVDFPDFNRVWRASWPGWASRSSTTSVRRSGPGGGAVCGRSPTRWT